MDNVSNNGAMMELLTWKLKPCDISFNPCNRRIICFAHIIDLCSGRAIHAASGVEHEGVLSGDKTASDPLAAACAAVQAI